MSSTVGGTLFFNRKYSWAIIFLGLIFSACGYRFAGEGNLPSNVKSIFIKILENRTGETGVENVFTNDLIYEFTRDRKVVLTSSDKADAILTGVIKYMRIRTISRKGSHTPLERRVQVAVDLKLTDPDGSVIWSAKGVSTNEAYNVDPDNNKHVTEQNRRVAISALSKRLAEKVYNDLTADF
jgi:outer membrane lipopolysaccharide assembly protein LptE/RlpB